MSCTRASIGVVALSLAAAIASAALARAASDLVIVTADGPRHALIVPAGPGPHPTVLVLHGGLGTASWTMRSTGFPEAARRLGFTAVFPDGLDRRWHDGRTGGPPGPDDIAFLRALVARLVADGIAEPARIYIAGISNGGMMSFTMACKAGELFAGVGSIIAAMPAGIEPCALRPVSLVMVSATADPMVPFGGGGIGLRGRLGEVWGAERTADLFASTDGCGAQVAHPLPHRDLNGTSVTRIDWTGCRPGTSVTLYRVEGGGHAVPGRPPLAPLILGPSNQDIVAADAIMDVFARAR